jgi:hypothetical protein
VVYTKSEHWDAGEQHITVNKSDIGTSGIYFYRIQTSDVSLVKKMIVE